MNRCLWTAAELTDSKHLRKRRQSGLFVRGLFLAGFMVLCQLGLRGEQFLSLPEALRICFPEATTFEERAFTVSTEQARTVADRSGVKTRPGRGRYWVVRRGAESLGVVIWDKVLGKHQWIDYVVAIDPAGAVKQVEVLEYRERYGAQIRDPQWRAQFRGKTAGDPFKLNEDIHNISGATISCRGVTQGVKRLVVTHDLVLAPELAAARGMPRAKPVSPGNP